VPELSRLCADSANLEAREAFGLLGGDVDPVDARSARSLAAELDEPLDRVCIPSSTASTEPSARLPTQPATDADSARRRNVSRKKTPWT
jgi:hypothetical protein